LSRMKTGLRDGDVTAGGEGDGDVGGGEGGRVVGAITDEGDNTATRLAGGSIELQGFDVFGFLVREDIGANIGDWNAELECDATGCGSIVASAHVDG